MNQTTPRIKAVRVDAPYVLELEFTDGVRGSVHVRDWIFGKGVIFQPLEDPVFFALVRLTETGGTIEWPNGVDFCPDVLYHAITGMPIELVDDTERAPVAPQG
jgi:hypothetical protein